MLHPFIEIGIFAGKVIILAIFVILLLVVFLSLIAKSKEKHKGKLHIKNLNRKYDEAAETFLIETLDKKDFKKYLKTKKAESKAKENNKPDNVFVLSFHGDLKASTVGSLSEEVTAILNIATPKDEIVLRLESPGGIVPGYGLAAAQLMRIRDKGLALTVCVDKVAASGGYMMAAIANQIIAAPFAIVGSIGVIVQLPNFNRFLKDKNIDVEQHTAGEFKRTITLFGENTDEGREKLKHEIEDVHQLFKNLITEHRPNVDIQKVATGEHWYGQQALALHLVDKIQTSDDYLLARSKEANLYEVSYEMKKPLFARLSGAAGNLTSSFLQ